MASFRNGEVEIAYLDEGAGEPIVLVHGFASNKEVNWVKPGWVETLTGAGRRVIALDNRGHGASSKLYEPSAYHSATMAEDVRALLDHLNIERADVRDPTGRSFRSFAEQTQSDLKALAACMRGSRQTLPREQVAGIRVPVLVAVGTEDKVAGSAQELAALIPGARALDIPDRDHMLAVGDKMFKAGVLDFLNQRN